MEHQRADDPAMQTVRELATHSADIRHLQTDMDKMTKDMEEIKDAIREISKTLSEAKGGWKLLLVVGGIGASVATFVTWLTAKGRAKYNAATGSNLKAPQPSGGPRKKSFCARMSGMPGPMKDESGKPTRKAASLKRWNCGSK